MSRICALTHSGTAFVSALLVLVLLSFSSSALSEKVKLDPSNWGHPAGEECISCHKKASAGVVNEWEKSAHHAAGVNCMDCHQAKVEEADSFEHEGQIIATIVSPLDCATCHVKESKEHKGSVHSEAVALARPERDALGSSLGGSALLAAGCDQCHGSVVEVRGDGSLDPTTWPNSGIGRINPDGSKGSCSACHGRHRFSKAQARKPEACRRCHDSAKSPDQAVFESSKHGIAYESHISEMNFTSDSWAAGEDYSAAPTCVTCHMGAAGKVKATHDVGMRSAWKLYGPVSQKHHLVMFEDGSKRELPIDEAVPRRGEELEKIDGSMGVVKFAAKPKRRRQIMSAVCRECHSKTFAKGFFQQFDSLVELYNDKYGEPARSIMQALYDRQLLTAQPFDEPLEFTYWELWHDRAASLRHGAAMASPDHASLVGMLPVAKLFYGSFIPQVRAVAGDQADELIGEFIKSNSLHQWMSSPDQATSGLEAELGSVEGQHDG